MESSDLESRAERFAALGDPVRLAIIDELSLSDRAPIELRQSLGMESNLLAHHLEVLERAGLIERARSSGDGRRRYVRLRVDALADLVLSQRVRLGPALFVCTANSARSQLAAVLWQSLTGFDARSAGTHPAERVHTGAIAAARRAGLDLRDAVPRGLASMTSVPDIVVTVCDRAHEELDATQWLHWSIVDPVMAGTAEAFDAALDQIRQRIRAVVGLREAS